MERTKIYQIILHQHQKQSFQAQQIRNTSACGKNTEQPVKYLLENDNKLSPGSNFWSIEDNFQTIYLNFNVLAYFSPAYQIKILNQFNFQSSGKKMKLYKFSFNKQHQQLYLLERQRDKIQTNIYNQKFPLTIFYQIYQNVLYNNNKIQLNYNTIKAKIKVQFKIERQFVESCKSIHQTSSNSNPFVRNKNNLSNLEKIIINIIDQQKWIQTNSVCFLSQINSYYRGSEQNKSKRKQIQYFYKQNESSRNKKMQDEHLSIILQGGGAKSSSYIGACSAYAEALANKKIFSLIGTSAGSLFCLGLLCQSFNEDFVAKNTYENYSKLSLYQKYPTKNNELSHKTYSDLLSFLKKYNIIDDPFLNIISQSLEDERIQSLVLELISVQFGQQFGNLFKDWNTKKLNLTGLLNASLVNSKNIKRSATMAIQVYLKRLVMENNKKCKNIFPQLFTLQRQQLHKQIMAIAESINLRDFYYLTQTEFTCVSFDLDNHIIRFFNQKTTPLLPVCQAVTYSSSIPIVFERCKWQKQWGKYYIHYENFRREVDLTDCDLVDGGFVSNFPIQYIDNQQFRPMYFSHMKNEKTKMLGFTINSKIKQNQEESIKNIQKAKKVREITKKLIKLLIPKFSIQTTIKSWLSSTLGKKSNVKNIQLTEQSFKQLNDIPLVSFTKKCLKALDKMKDNLTKQAFSHKTHKINLSDSYKNQIAHPLAKKYFIQQLQKIQKIVKNQLYSQSSYSLQSQQSIMYIIIQNLREIERKCRFCLPKQNQLISILQKVLFIMKNIQAIVLQYYNKRCQSIQSLDRLIAQINILQQMNYCKYFVHCNVKVDLESIIKAANISIIFCSQILQIQDYGNNNLQKLIYNHLQDFKNKNKFIFESILSKINQYKNSQTLSIDYQFLFQLQQITQNNLCLPIKIQESIRNAISMSRIPTIFIHYETLKSKRKLQNYVMRNLNQHLNKQTYNFQTLRNPNDERITPQTNSNKHQYLQNFSKYIPLYDASPTKEKQVKLTDGIHIVFQSAELSEIYYFEYMTYIKSALMKLNYFRQMDGTDNQILRITTMTASDYHSILIFLLASDFNQKKIGSQILRIRSLTKYDMKQINKKYENKNWAEVNSLIIDKLHKQIQIKRMDIIDYLQKELISKQKGNNFDQLQKNMKNKMNQAKQYRNQLKQAIDIALDHVTQILQKINQKDISDKEKKQKLYKILKADFQQKKYRQQSLACLQNLKQMAHYFLTKFEDIVKYLIYSTGFAAEQIIKKFAPQDRKQAWKALLLATGMSATQIKKYVQQKLVQMRLNPQITLKQYYEQSPKKIQINFTVIEKNCLNILNYHTRPNMPVWAAIVATSSIPQLFPPLIDRPQWKYNISQNKKQKQLKIYFGQKYQKASFLSSAQPLTRFPLQILTNHKFQKKITNMNEIFLNFSFENYRVPIFSNNLIKEFKVSPLSLGQLVSKFVSFKSEISRKLFGSRIKNTQEQINLKALSMLFNIPSIKSKLHTTLLYLSASDRLVRNLYKDQIIVLRSSAALIQFQIIQVAKQNNKPYFCNKIKDDIIQSYYLTLQTIKNRELARKNETEHENESQKIIYFKIQKCKNKEASSNKENKIQLQFFTNFYPKPNLTDKIKIYYLIKQKYMFLPHQAITINLNDQPQIKLKFQYVSFDLNKVESFLTIDLQNFCDSEHNHQLKQSYIYQINLNKMYQCPQMIPPHQNYKNGAICTKVSQNNTPYKEGECGKFPYIFLYKTKNNQTNRNHNDYFSNSFIDSSQSLSLSRSCSSKTINEPMYKNYFIFIKNGLFSCNMGHFLKKKSSHYEPHQKYKPAICTSCSEIIITQFWHDEYCNESICHKCQFLILKRQ